MKFADLTQFELENTSIDDETAPEFNEDLMGFEAVNINDDETVTLTKDGDEITTDTWESIKSYLMDNIESLYGTYVVYKDNMPIYDVTLAG